MKIEGFLGNEFEYVTDEVSSVDIWQSNANEVNRKKWVTDLAAISRGKSQSNNPDKRYEQLLKEAAPNYCASDKDCQGYPSRPLEFLPVVLLAEISGDEVVLRETGLIGDGLKRVIATFSFQEWSNNLGKFGYLDNDGHFYTNMRALIYAGIPYEKIPYNTPEEIKTGKFFAVKLSVPMFVWAQLMTHTQISKESVSDRVAKMDMLHFWLPPDIREKMIGAANKDIAAKKNVESARAVIDLFENGSNNDIREALLALGQYEMQYLFNLAGYPKEISQRAIYYFRYKEFVMVGWGIDPHVWSHLFLERSATPLWNNWTQEQTKETVLKIKEIFDSKY